jgi:hypothetical protein
LIFSPGELVVLRLTPAIIDDPLGIVKHQTLNLNGPGFFRA